MGHSDAAERVDRPGSLPQADLRVVEIASDVAGEMTGRLLAQMGADVLKVEPVTGSPTRAIGPFAGDEQGPNRSLTFWYYNASKQSVSLEPDRAGDDARLEELIGEADVLLLSSPHWALDPHAISVSHPRLLVVVISPFGLSGPWAAYHGSDLVHLALGGVLHICGYDDHSIPPIRPGYNQAFHVAASSAHTAILLGLIERSRSGRGQVIDVSIHASVMLNLELALPFWFYNRVVVHRQTGRHAQPSPTQPAMFACADGKYVYLALMLADEKPWRALLDWMDSEGLAGDLNDPAYNSLDYRQEHFAHIQGLIEVFFLLHDGQTMYEEGQARGLPTGLVLTPDEVLVDSHFTQRSFFESVTQDDGTTIPYPGSPYRFSAFEAVPASAAPRLGPHDESRSRMSLVAE